MRQQLEHRLVELKAEYEKGQMRIYQLEREAAALRETTLRISGAIQLVEEVLSSSRRASLVDGAPAVTDQARNGSWTGDVLETIGQTKGKGE